MNNWAYLREKAPKYGSFETSLLGRVQTEGTAPYESVITDSFRRLAARNGFDVLAADFKRDVYTLRLR